MATDLSFNSFSYQKRQTCTRLAGYPPEVKKPNGRVPSLCFSNPHPRFALIRAHQYHSPLSDIKVKLKKLIKEKFLQNMEVCNCARYKELANKCRVFTFGDLRPSEPRLPVPENACIFWRKIKANHQDRRPDEPILITQVAKEEEKKVEEPFDSKWIPIMNHLISEKFVKETKSIKCPY